MILKQKDIIEIGSIIKNLYQNNNISISLKYKFLKLEENISKELNTINLLIDEVTIKYCEKEDNKPIFNENGTLKITEKNSIKLANEINDLLKLEITICDFYFSLEELEPLDLSWQELKSLMPLIK